MLKTLNFWYRKKECQRIEHENMALAKRLLDKGSEFNRRAMESDFKKHLTYKNQILKVKSNKYIFPGLIET